MKRIFALWLNLMILLVVPGLGAAESLADLRAKAEKGDAIAQYSLGMRYANGWGVAKDPSEVVKWFRKAAEQGLPDAQYYLSGYYRRGEGVAKDETEALEWMHKAAEQGHAVAEFSLGVAYRYGFGVARDPAEPGGRRLKVVSEGRRAWRWWGHD